MPRYAKLRKDSDAVIDLLVGDREALQAMVGDAYKLVEAPDSVMRGFKLSKTDGWVNPKASVAVRAELTEDELRRRAIDTADSWHQAYVGNIYAKYPDHNDWDLLVGEAIYVEFSGKPKERHYNGMLKRWRARNEGRIPDRMEIKAYAAVILQKHNEFQFLAGALEAYKRDVEKLPVEKLSDVSFDYLDIGFQSFFETLKQAADVADAEAQASRGDD